MDIQEKIMKHIMPQVFPGIVVKEKRDKRDASVQERRRAKDNPDTILAAQVRLTADETRMLLRVAKHDHNTGPYPLYSSTSDLIAFGLLRKVPLRSATDHKKKLASLWSEAKVFFQHRNIKEVWRVLSIIESVDQPDRMGVELTEDGKAILAGVSVKASREVL